MVSSRNEGFEAKESGELMASTTSPSDTSGRDRRVGYTDPARRYIEMTAGDRVSAKRMTLVAYAFAFALVISLVGNLYQSQLPREIPYVIRESSSGQTSTGVALAPATRPDEAWIRYQLARWIVEARTGTTDPRVQAAFAQHTAALILRGSGAQTMVAAHVQQVAQGGNARVAVKINFVRPRSGSSGLFEGNWVETSVSPAGRVLEEQHWSGVFTLDFAQSNVSLTDDASYANPYGMYIAEIQWNQERY